MKTRIIKIGNSQGIRIPKVLLEQSGLSEEVEIEVHAAQIVIRPADRPRSGWDEAFRPMAEHEDDRLVDEDLTGQTDWDMTEWQW
jgi:antitoxin MazE